MIGHIGWEALVARRYTNTRLQMMYRLFRTPAGDAWQRWLTISTRKTHGGIFHLAL